MRRGCISVPWLWASLLVSFAVSQVHRRRIPSPEPTPAPTHELESEIWEQALIYVDRVCNDCICRGFDNFDCENSAAGRDALCTWNRAQWACRFDPEKATPIPHMMQCDPNGFCYRCKEINVSVQCGYQMYPEQRINCSWDQNQADVNGRGCIESQEEIAYQHAVAVIKPQSSYNSLVSDYHSHCTSMPAEEGPNCSADTNCTFRFDEEDPMSSYCLAKAGSPSYREFYGQLGYNKEWMDQQELCHGPTMQSTCIATPGCAWEGMKCVVGNGKQCKLQCNTTAPDRLVHAYIRTTEQQCGEPCDISESYMEAGTDGGPYDVTERHYAEQLCGEQCNMFSECAGFDVDSTTGRCYYRKSTSCYTRRNSNRDCFTKKAKCSTLECPAGYLKMPMEQESFCAGLTCNLAADRDSCCKKAICVDKENWYSGKGCDEDGYSLNQGCTPAGWTCKAYEVWHWCEPSRSGIARGTMVGNTEWAFGEANNYPEQACCICGGGEQILDGVEMLPTDPPLHRIAAAPPENHICCIGLGPGRDKIRALLPEELNHTAVQQVQCVTDSTEASVPPLSKPGAACQYCMCLEGDGADFYNDPVCCSLKHFGEPGVDENTALPYCARYNSQFNLDTGVVRSCELRYDLYPFSVGKASSSLRLTWLLLPALGALLSLASGSSYGLR